MNRIPAVQDSEPQLRQLAAQRWLYSRAKRVFGFQVIVCGPVTVCVALSAVACAEAKPYLAAWGLLVALADLLWLSRWQKALREEAARIQEAFDCQVLELPWHELKTGKPIDPELVLAYAGNYERVATKFDPLPEWYPTAVGTLPIETARVLCQRINCLWDRRQRIAYTRLVAAVLAGIVVALVACALAFRMPMTDFFLLVVAPFSPLVLLCIRQIIEHTEATERLAKLKEHANGIRDQALANTPPTELTRESRALQDEIFDARKRQPSVLDSIYERLRPEHEVDMKLATEEDVRSFSKQTPSAER